MNQHKKIISAKAKGSKFSSRHTKVMENAAREWRAQVEQEFELAEAAELTEKERQGLADAELAVAEALGFGSALVATREIEQARLNRIQKVLDKQRRKHGGKGAG